MTLSDKQQGTLKRMAAGTAVAFVYLALAAFGPWSDRINARASWSALRHVL